MSNQTETLRHRLTDRLPHLSYLATALVIRRTLLASGYHHVRLSDRLTLRGRSHSAGVDIRAQVDEPAGTLPVLIQLKVSRNPIGTRSVDQLRSCLLVEGASHGLLVSTSSFTAAAIQGANRYPGRPILLVDGPALSLLMIEHRIGICEGLSLITGKPELVVNETALANLDFACRLHLRRRKGVA